MTPSPLTAKLARVQDEEQEVEDILDDDWIPLPKGVKSFQDLPGSMVEYETFDGKGFLGKLSAFRGEDDLYKLEINIELPKGESAEPHFPRAGLIDDFATLRPHPNPKRAKWILGDPPV
ncbi:hypothetical protein [Haloferula sp. BvORR071]|uniref:hypothetical protein n=1 Tax=Haloferula sp. BvORR071 TaxID=1396141 RepID=UPI000555549D|nr:hypothetical protein [Haloferula sp. BvORR071]